ncbi:hypothetical protein JTB14_027821 [Gonioctena quinquepunctata]|nr:hypothetical protein JTB14_027821 [Gonioctena quinquepunctata]
MSTMPNNELTDLKFDHGQTKGKLTRTKHYLESLDPSKIDNTIFNQLNLRLQRLEPIFNEFSDIQTRIERLELENIEQESKNHEEFENSYYQLVAQMTDEINVFANKSTSVNTDVVTQVHTT